MHSQYKFILQYSTNMDTDAALICTQMIVSTMKEYNEWVPYSDINKLFNKSTLNKWR